MRQFRFIFIAILTSLFVINAVFWRKAIATLLCGVLSFNSTSCYSFLGAYEQADAAVLPSSTTVIPEKTSNAQKDGQKVAICLFGACIDTPKIPVPIPGVPGGDPLGTAKAALFKQIGESLGIGSPLLLDQSTAYPDASDQVKDFHPQPLTITSAEDLNKPLLPGDYSLSVIAYCTQFSIHAPGQGLPYKLAPLLGKQAPAISALLSRGTLQGIAPVTLNASAWRIQAGLPLKQWPQQDQALIHKLIPEYEKGLQGDYLQQIEDTYNQFRLVPGLPSLDNLLRDTGPPGQIVLQLRQARKVLSDQTVAAERLPDMLYEPTGDGLPRVLPPTKDVSSSRWAEIKPGIFARFTVIQGNLGRNLLELRVAPKTTISINNSNVATRKGLEKNLVINRSKASSQEVALLPLIPLALILDGIIGYATLRGAQALIVALNVIEAKNCGSEGGNKSPTLFPGSLGTPEYYQKRADDFKARNNNAKPPDYYLDFGFRNLSHFMKVTYNNPNLSLAGKKFLDTVKINLQQIMEDDIKRCGSGFAQLEKDAYAFRQYAYMTHVKAYCQSGWGELQQRDRDIIINDVSFSDKYNPSQFGGVVAGTVITGACGGGLYDLLPNSINNFLLPNY